MRSKKSARSKRTTGTRKSVARKPVAETTMGPWTIGLMVLAVAVMVLMAARPPAPSSADTSVAEPPQASAQEVPVAQPRAATTASPASKTPEPEAEPKAAVQEFAAATNAVTTVSGCLERDGDAFRLKDTTGTEVPTSRSWRSGFLKKGPASIEIVDAANSLSLSNHVGQRVSVSGTLEDREMQARSLRRVSTSCDQQLIAKARTN